LRLEYSYQILLKSDNWFSTHSQKCRGYFWDIVYKCTKHKFIYLSPACGSTALC